MTAAEPSRGIEPRSDPDRMVVEATNVHKWFGALHVLKGIDLSITQGEVVCVVGPSGSGKSTFLRTINHLEPIDRGSILVNGHPVGYAAMGDKPVSQREARIALGRRDIGMVFQDFNLFWHMTLLDNVMVGPRTVLGLSRSEAQSRAVELLNRVGLGEKAGAYPQSLSGGQQQRGAIARALAMEPRLMLFDEPTSALDPDMSREVVSVVEKLAKEGMTMIIVSHEMSFVRRAATRVVMMDGGIITEELRDMSAVDLSETNGIGAYLNATL
jgi:polar amino acid transport system ATP-binding protein